MTFVGRSRPRRSLRDLLIIMERLTGAQAGFSSVTEAIDTTSSAGRMMMQMVGAFAEFERAMLRERLKWDWMPPGEKAGRVSKPRARRTALSSSALRCLLRAVSKRDG